MYILSCVQLSIDVCAQRGADVYHAVGPCLAVIPSHARRIRSNGGPAWPWRRADGRRAAQRATGDDWTATAVIGSCRPTADRCLQIASTQTSDEWAPG